MPRTEEEQQPAPQGDPWLAFGYLVSGVLLYGAVGWLADWWLGTEFLVVIGILLGAGLGIYMTFKRFGGMPTSADEQSHGKETE
ncbi:AtpZ/AtpI family protein [Nocardioides sp.]|uniref:AtpZ/AtpI family protein n=1 Tax=Nocardioides sp. TaxID=35761 RepID=UPI002D80632C|nr:AtpZ/AtpI family protein [Nocardioides sp.]